MITFVAHVHMFDATQQLGLGLGGMGCDNVSCWDVCCLCTCTHVQCSATAAFLAGMFTFFALALLRFFGSKVTSKKTRRK